MRTRRWIVALVLALAVMGLAPVSGEAADQVVLPPPVPRVIIKLQNRVYIVVVTAVRREGQRQGLWSRPVDAVTVTIAAEDGGPVLLPVPSMVLASGSRALSPRLVRVPSVDNTVVTFRARARLPFSIGTTMTAALRFRRGVAVDTAVVRGVRLSEVGITL